MAQELREVKLSDLSPNPHNFRTNFSGTDFDELVESIRQKGVLQPILVRPIEGKKKFEIVFGERRSRASKKAGKKTIPAVVRNLSDSEAYDMMIIENLHRDDLSEFEEACGFKRYLDKNGPESLADLADRTGAKPAYIRRRVKVLELPAQVLEAWEKGEIRYGYLEQLSRLTDEAAILELFEDIKRDYGISSVKELKREIDGHAIDLKYAVFDLEQEGCLACNCNSDVQLRLFEIDTDKTKCTKPGCFAAKQDTWLAANWKKTTYRKKFKTTGHRFTDNVDRHQCNFFRFDCKPGKACFKCEAFVTVFSGLQLNVHFDRLCIGESKCFKKLAAEAKKPQKTAPDAESGEAATNDKPRVEWHGVHFREIFFKETIPQRLMDLPSDGQTVAQLALFALVKSEHGLHEWFSKKYVRKESDAPDGSDGFYYYDADGFFDVIAAMSLQQVNEAMKAATLQVALLDGFMESGRKLLAGHIGIDLSKEWIFTQAYLHKKTIAEMLGMGERLGIFSDPKAKLYLSETLNKKEFGKCKKKELIQVFLESGVDLVGKVPAEIMG